ncbi:hypothetical protein ACHAWO_007109 [Cyclotella atomus]|uniref:tetrahydrofolate synthase n=1 Tax=Cyclotella atomus TaxID=382360 RepID=A0ABD3P286_9STRA
MSSKVPSQSETYDAAVQALLSPLHQATTPETLRAAAARRTNTLQDMHTYLHRIGLDVNNNPNRVPKIIFHITGTKGKGSTLAFCESILRNGYGLNTGMFTSPHLVCIRERIRMNGLPISEEAFAKVYWAIRNRLESHNDSDDAPSSSENELPPLPVLPGYFRMLTLMAIYTFCYCKSPKIDAMLLEVGMGGRYDCTNLFEPSVHKLIRGVTLIDYDHMRVLGSTLEQIAWEKGGIFCSNKLSTIGRCDGGYDAFLNQFEQSSDVEIGQERSIKQATVFASGNNTHEVLGILQYIANNDAQLSHLQVVVESCLDVHTNIGLKGQHQRSNAALALIMCQHAMDASPSLEKLQTALGQTFWPGRCHTVSLPTIKNETIGPEVSVTLRCDGAHTPISISACIDWFRSVASNQETIHRALVFNCSHERNPLPLLYSLHASHLFDSVYFCHADFERPSMLKKKLEEQWYTQDITDNHITFRDMSNLVGAAKCDAPTWQKTLANVWKVFNAYERHINPDSMRVDERIVFGSTVKAALNTIRNDVSVQRETAGKHNIEICVTGSLYIVGSALEAAGWQEQFATFELDEDIT